MRMIKKYNLFIMVSISLLILAFAIKLKSSNNHQLLSESLYFNKINIIYDNSICLVSDKNHYTKDDTIYLYIINNTKDEYSCGEVYALEMLYKNNWYYVSTDTGYQLFNLVEHFLRPRSKSSSFKIDLSEYYSRLSKGTYRIYKEIKDSKEASYVIYFEFTVE